MDAWKTGCTQKTKRSARAAVATGVPTTSHQRFLNAAATSTPEALIG